MYIGGISFIGLGLLLFGVSVVEAFGMVRFRIRGERTTGRIVSVREPSYGPGKFLPTVNWQSSDGEARQFEASEYCSEQAVGTTVDLVYLHLNPPLADLASRTTGKAAIKAAGSVLGGLALMAVGIALIAGKYWMLNQIRF